VLELNPGWTSSLNIGKDVRKILYFVDKRMSVAEICYNMHASSFHVYAQLYDLVNNGIARVAGEVPPSPVTDDVFEDLPEAVPELLWAARCELDEENPESALSIIHKVLREEPKNAEAQRLLFMAEEKFVERVYATQLSPHAVPKVLVAPESLTEENIGPQEGFVLSRINGEWDVESILSICPFREADSLRMIKTLLNKGIIGL
jgi:hypothetical protein